jgi:hypothetical protein
MKKANTFIVIGILILCLFFNEQIVFAEQAKLYKRKQRGWE